LFFGVDGGFIVQMLNWRVVVNGLFGFAVFGVVVYDRFRGGLRFWEGSAGWCLVLVWKGFRRPKRRRRAEYDLLDSRKSN